MGAAARPRDPGRADPDGAPPLLRVVRGEPTADELGALLAVLGARSAAVGRGGPVRRAAARTAWADPARTLRPVAPPPAPGGWRASALPGTSW